VPITAATDGNDSNDNNTEARLARMRATMKKELVEFDQKTPG
jgi:hypothetical protein